MTASNSRIVRAPRGTQMTCKSWLTEAALRMLMNNLDPDVAERPEDLVVYGGIGKAALDWASFDAIVANPPFSYRWEPTDALADDVRFKSHGLAPKSAADFAFLLHGFHFLKDEGVSRITSKCTTCNHFKVHHFGWVFSAGLRGGWQGDFAVGVESWS